MNFSILNSKGKKETHQKSEDTEMLTKMPVQSKLPDKPGFACKTLFTEDP
jgi:hypothetical protein